MWMDALKGTLIMVASEVYFEMRRELGLVVTIYERLENCTSLEVELWAVYKGLTILLQRGMDKVIVETNAEHVQLLEEGPSEKFPFNGLVEDARIILRDVNVTSNMSLGVETLMLMPWLSLVETNQRSCFLSMAPQSKFEACL
ncbi:hypothetical protein ACSBR2_025324 [Camellia fascicularis]